MLKANHSTKVSEKFTVDDDKIIIKKTFDASHMLKDAAQAREVTQNSFGSQNTSLSDFFLLALPVLAWSRYDL